MKHLPPRSGPSKPPQQDDLLDGLPRILDGSVEVSHPGRELTHPFAVVLFVGGLVEKPGPSTRFPQPERYYGITGLPLS